MSFEGAWGFDPEKALNAQKEFQRVLVCTREVPEEEVCLLSEPDEVRICVSTSSQIHELHRLFRL
jgi:hypothetical protein